MATQDILVPGAGFSTLCQNVVKTRYEHLSKENIRLFKMRLLDLTGCILGGQPTPEDQFMTNRLLDWGGKPEAAVFARGARLPLPHAALLNSLYARANDFGSMFFRFKSTRMPSHCGETLAPLALTLADAKGVSGKDFISRYVAAEDLTARLLYTFPTRWPADMLLVSGAAAALAAPYYGLDAQGLGRALSYAATNATDPANSYYDYCEEFKYHNAESARMGIMAAEIAAAGCWRGLKDPYYGHWGMVSKKVPNEAYPPLYPEIFEDLGKVYYTEESFKSFPGGIPMTPATLCALNIRAQILAQDGSFEPDKVRQVRVYRSGAIRPNYYSEPFVLNNHTNALFCYRFSVCCALYYGAFGVKEVQTPAIAQNPLLTRWAGEATMEVYEPKDGGRKMKVEVELTDGRSFAAEESSAAVHARPTPEAVQQKFREQAALCGKFYAAQIEKIIDLAERIDTLPDVREYTRLLWGN